MKKNIFYLFIVFVAALVMLVGCDLPAADDTGDNNDPVVKKVDYKAIKFNDATFDYDGKEHAIEVTGKIPEGYSIEYDANKQTMFGTYDVVASLVNDSTKEVEYTYKAKLTITVPEIEVEFTQTSFVFDGEDHEVTIKGEIPYGLTASYNGKNVVNKVGKYKISVDLYYGEKYITDVRTIAVVDNPDDEEFAKYCDELFVEFFEGDQFSINWFFVDPSAYGIEHQEAINSRYTPVEDFDADQALMQEEIDELHEFKNHALSLEQQATYRIIDDYFTYVYNITENMIYMTNNYLGSYLGKQCDLPMSIAEYHIRNEQDIKDVIAFINDVEDAFKNYYTFAEDMIEYGYAMADYVIDNVISQCTEVVNMGEDNFVIAVLCQKIDEATFDFVEHTKEEYKDLVKTGILGPYTAGYKYIADNLGSLKGNATVYGGLAMYGDEGKACYANDLSNVLGLENINVDQIYNYMLGKFRSVDLTLNNIVEQYSALPSAQANIFYAAVVDGESVYDTCDFEDILPKFREYAKSLVPEIEEMPTININYVPEALQENYSPAAYFISALDETSVENIYLNPKYTEDYNYIYITLAHEGYPGHLYQNVYAKSLDISNVRKLLKCSGYAEGWATYMEHKAYEFSETWQASKGLALAAQYNKYNSLWGLCIEAIIDIAIHYKGVTLEEMTTLFNDLTGQERTSDEFVDLYEQLCEIPTNMSMYAISYFILQDLHDQAVNTLGDYFDEVEFNKVILDMGSAPLCMVQEAVYDYLNDMIYIHHITL